MQSLNPESLLRGKQENARIQIAESVGDSLSVKDLATADRRAAELLARALADDAIERVRSALSHAICHARHLPRDLALKLSHDVDSVACPFLEATEVFSDDDWLQLLLTISRNARSAVARRPNISADLALILAEIADSVVAETLIENPNAPMTKPVCYTLMDRFAPEIWVLDKLAARNDLITEIAITLTDKVSAAMRKKLVNTYKLPGYTEALADEAAAGAVIQIVKKTAVKDLIEVAKALQGEDKLTPSLLLRAIEDKQDAFLEASLSVLSGRSIEHVRSVILRAGPEAMNQLLERAQIASDMRQPFQDSFLRIRTK